MTWYEFGEEENYLILDTEVRNDQKLERQFCDIMIEKLTAKRMHQNSSIISLVDI